MLARTFRFSGGFAIGWLCWSAMGQAQIAAPTLQPPGTPVGAEEAAETLPESWAVHGQATNTSLFQPAFRSAFEGLQSLKADTNARETLDFTLYAGVRPWQGAEFWFNPEIDQGFGLSNTFGVAGYPSGEAYMSARPIRTSSSSARSCAKP